MGATYRHSYIQTQSNVTGSWGPRLAPWSVATSMEPLQPMHQCASWDEWSQVHMKIKTIKFHSNSTQRVRDLLCASQTVQSYLSVPAADLVSVSGCNRSVTQPPSAFCSSSSPCMSCIHATHTDSWVHETRWAMKSGSLSLTATLTYLNHFL